MALNRTTVNVSAYGAAGNGLFDDTAAITRALAAAGPNGKVLFDYGRTYKTTSQITIPYDGMVLEGYGSIITSATDSQYQKFLFSGRARGKVLGIRFDCLYASASTGLSAGTIEVANSTDITIRDCEFNDIARNGIYVSGTSSRIIITHNRFYRNFCAIFSDDDGVNQPTALNISDNQILTGLGGTGESFSGAIKISGNGSWSSSARHVISGNIIDTCGQMGIETQTYVNDCVISGNTIIGTGYGISVSICARVSVVGNTIRNVVSYGIEFADSTSVSASGNTINGSSSAEGILVIRCSHSSITGGTIGLCARSVHLYTTTGIAISSVHMTPGSQKAIDLQAGLGGSRNIAISNNIFNVTGTTLTFEFMVLDTDDGNLSGVLIDGNHFNGTVTNNGINLYAPDTGFFIHDVQVSNNQCQMNCPGGAWTTNASVNQEYTIRGIRCFNNINASTTLINGFNIPVHKVANNFTVPWNHYYNDGGLIGMDVSAAAGWVQLPNHTGMAGYQLSVIKTDSSSNIVSISGYAGATINGLSSIALTSQYRRVTMVCDASNWFITQSGAP